MSASLLAAWERGQGRDPAARSVVLLSATTGRDEPAVVALDLGARDRLLFDLRRRVFGDRLGVVDTCPACGERLETPVDLAGLCAGLTHADAAPVVEHDDLIITVRVPDSEDAYAAAATGDVAQARLALIRRCLSVVDSGGAPVDVTGLPAEAVARAAERIAELAPHSDVRLRLSCPSCDQQWSAALDIGLVVWIEVAVWARRVLRQVHEIASVYGWSEEQILGLGPHRRQAYLDLVAS